MRGLAAIALAGLAGVAGGGAGSSALAAPPKPIVTVPLAADTAHAQTATVLYMNRCRGGCVIHKAGNDARTDSSLIPDPDGTSGQTDFTMSEFAWGDVEWDAIVKCVQEVYSPFGMRVTDVRPTGGEGYNEEIVAGTDREILVHAGGIAPINSDCTPYSYVVSFTFANTYGPNQRVFELCAVAAQESGHAYGLDHTYSFADGSSGCRDPMTYRSDCGGQKFFRNDQANCGEFSARPCRCGGQQNSHLKLLSEIGPGTPITAPPMLTVTQPQPGVIGNGASVIATASAQRGIKTIELWLNGYLWASAKGVTFGTNGQPEAGYAIPIPAAVPDGVIDIVVKAKDDIDVTTTAQTITVTKGLPCATAASCAAGQSCEGGRCFWAPATGQIGEDCTYPQFCLSGVCQGTASQTICTQACIVGVADSCPDATYDCIESSPGKGICWPKGAADPGCCSAGNAAAAQSMLVAFGLLFVIRRRRR